ncbi:MAG: flagellar filament capping protein FliD [Spirochaetales bacterium]|uniref:Flagellar hook-associated protein 2 n=1 Tax=Candidatus Thalassospirochaeta sargassi TaxID=3119039 RepID=A0AAJ1IEY2_9SPIO|nr:flagellar filament capping protein FliD [Spirochaetales bacterium]
MSDITIPGVNSGLNTDSIVSKLMELERIPLERKEDERDSYKNEKTIWQDLSRDLTKLEDSAKALYGADNPFNERIAESSNERVLTAVAERGALEQEKEITVLQKASADRFLSDSIDKDFEAPSGTYTFGIGDEEISFNFRGGSISRLADRINSRGRDMLRAQVIKDTPDTTVMLIESTKEGLENKLEFKDGAALEFAVSAGILRQVDSSLRIIPAEPAEGARGTSEDSSGRTLLAPGAEGLFRITPPVKDNGKLLVEFDVQINNLEEGEWTPPEAPEGPASPSDSSIDFKGINIYNSGSSISLPEWDAPLPPEKIVDLEVFSSRSGSSETFFPALRDTEQKQKITVSLADLGGTTDSIAFKNNNTFKNISISEIKIYDPNARGDWEPAKPIDQASNSRLMVDGIEIIRNSNTIDDLVPGVTLTLRGEDEEPIDLTISPDNELVKDSIISFFGNYNRIQADLAILTSNDATVISEIDYFTEDEVQKANERLGYFQGDSTLIQMKSRLQLIMMEAYSSPTDDTLRLLSQIGISTNSSGFGAGLNNSKLRGYIEINEDTLDSILETNIRGVKDLFGLDTDGDLVIDNGAAYKAQEYMSPYTGSNGILAYRMTSLDSRISSTESDITSYELKLEDTEADLKNKYAIMEGNINAMQQSSNSLNNLNNNNN